MVNKNLLANIESGIISVANISNDDFKMLMSDPSTQSYGLMLCNRVYFMKAMQNINQNMNNININDEVNNQILMDTYDLVRMDKDGKFYINSFACAMEFQKYFTQSLNEMVDIKTGKANIRQIVSNTLNIRRNLKIIKINLNIMEQTEFLKKKYILETDSKYNFTTVLLNGWNEFQMCLTNGDLIDELDYYDNVEELFEMSVSTIGSLDGLFREFTEDIKKLKNLLEARKKFYY